MSPSITDEMAERGGRALYERCALNLKLSSAMPAWEDLADDYRVEWKESARAVLEAALGGEQDER